MDSQTTRLYCRLKRRVIGNILETDITFAESEGMPEALEPFPEIRALGHTRLQELCNDWCQLPQAKEFGLASITVTPDCMNLQPAFLLPASTYDKGDTLHFPFDRITEFLVDRGIPESARDSLKDRLRKLRQKAGVTVFQRYKTNVQAYTMAVRCKACSHLLLTQYRIFKGQTFKLEWADPLVCSKCRAEFPVSEKDFFPVIDPDRPGTV